MGSLYDDLMEDYFLGGVNKTRCDTCKTIHARGEDCFELQKTGRKNRQEDEKTG